MNYTSNMT